MLIWCQERQNVGEMARYRSKINTLILPLASTIVVGE